MRITKQFKLEQCGDKVAIKSQSYGLLAVLRGQLGEYKQRIRRDSCGSFFYESSYKKNILEHMHF